MLDSIRLSLRLVSNDFDSEILELIEACKRDLAVGGVSNIDEKVNEIEPLILRAVTLYCKGHFGFANMGEKYLEAYESLKVALYMEGLTNV